MVVVEGVYLPLVEDTYGLAPEGRKLRAFQKEFIDCVNDEYVDVIQLVAPTGAGKTLCFEYLLNQKHKVLLLYPTNALIQSQMQRFGKEGFRVANISSKILKRRGQERAKELWGLIERYDIILTNPDIFQAIVGAMYTNPEGDLIQVFREFNYVIYDEFHAYSEFELSGILTQIALFLNMSRCRVILSSATPKTEILKLLNFVLIGENRQTPTIKSVEAKPGFIEGEKPIRYRTEVKFHQGKILDNIEEIADKLTDATKEIKMGEPQILLIFDRVKDSNWFYSRLYKEYPDLYRYVEKDNGYDTNQVGDAPDFTKPILISTNKSELGLDYPIKMLFMEDGFSFDSFIQRFGRAARHEPAECYIYTKKEANPLFKDESVGYQNFLDKIRYITDDYNIQKKKVIILFTFRQALAIEGYSHQKYRGEDLRAFFAVGSGYSYKLWLKFFALLNKDDGLGLTNQNLDRLNLLVKDLKGACRSLRGRSLQCPVLYQRGHEVRRTAYDVLSVLNRVPAVVEKTDEGLIIRELESEDSGPFIKAITLPYFPAMIDYQKRNDQFREEIETIAKNALSVFEEKDQGFLHSCIRSLCYSVDPDRVILPEEVILWNDKVVPLSEEAMEFYDD
jgi:CRISPR-associated endonuclease/helicase Cas3